MVKIWWAIFPDYLMIIGPAPCSHLGPPGVAAAWAPLAPRHGGEALEDVERWEDGDMGIIRDLVLYIETYVYTHNNYIYIYIYLFTCI